MFRVRGHGTPCPYMNGHKRAAIRANRRPFLCLKFPDFKRGNSLDLARTKVSGTRVAPSTYGSKVTQSYS